MKKKLYICAKIISVSSLEKSIKEHNIDVDFLIFVADEFSDEEKNQ
jgi:hypothetical protein